MSPSGTNQRFASTIQPSHFRVHKPWVEGSSPLIGLPIQAQFLWPPGSVSRGLPTFQGVVVALKVAPNAQA